MIFTKKTAAFFLLLGFMLSGPVARELKKFPLLATHYYEHRQQNRGIGILSFLFMHYCTDDGTDRDAAEDNKLPFKSDINAASFSSVYLPLRPQCIIERSFCIRNNGFFSRNDSFLSELYLNSIWQPPRLS